MQPDGKVNILIVDDRPDRVLALSTILEGLGENVVGAHSGREALRHLLYQDFAVVLLDIHMPGMDGFETASLIRQRPSTRDIPIIFITAYEDELQLVQSYSLRAVDHIQIPVIPEILRTKVSVLVDLQKTSVQVRQQAEWLRRQAARLHKLTAASLAINSAVSLETLLDIVTSTVRDVLEVHLASATTILNKDGTATASAAAMSDEYSTHVDGGGRTAAAEPRGTRGGARIREMLQRANRPIRMTQLELDSHPAWDRHEKTWRGLPLHGWLAVPFTGRDGRNIGWVEATSKIAGDFDADDEAILVQLAQMASIAIENAFFAQEREVNRLKDEFLWTLSHELRTPLNSILGWTQVLSSETEPEETARAIEVIDRNARAQTKLIDDMLDLSRIIMGKLRLNRRPLDLRDVLEAAIENVRPLARDRGVSLECCAPRQPVPVNGDPDRLQQVIGNLLSNALKFTPRDGSVWVELAAENSLAQLSVADTGQGIKPEFLPYVFERFRQADSSTMRPHSGLGIGLTIAQNIVRLHGGRIRAESGGEGQGATFTVHLPIETRQPEMPGEQEFTSAAEDHTAPKLDGLRVLLVDDDGDALHAATHLLERLGAEVDSVTSADEALELVRQSLPNVIVSDIGMPGRDGYDLIRSLRALPPQDGGELPAVALTAYAHEHDTARARSAGFQLHLAKPVEPAALAHAILKVCRDHCPI